VRKAATAKRTRVTKETTVMVSSGRKQVARKKAAMAPSVHQRGMGQPPASVRVRNSVAARPATMATTRVRSQWRAK